MPTLSAGHIAPQSGGYEPQRSYDFYIELIGLAGLDVIQLSTRNAFIPNPQSEVITIPFFAEERKVAGRLRFADGRIECVDYVDENTFGKLLEWRKLVHNIETGAQGYATDYKKEGNIVLVDPKGVKERAYHLQGVWPSMVEGSNLSYDSNEALTINMTLVFDIATPLF